MIETQELTDAEAKEVKKSKVKVSEAPMEPMTIKVDAGLKDIVQTVADQEGKTPSELCREILDKSLTGNPGRRRAGLLRSLAITKEQLNAALKDEDSLPWFKARPCTRAIKAIEELEEELNPTPRKSWIHRGA